MKDLNRFQRWRYLRRINSNIKYQKQQLKMAKSGEARSIANEKNAHLTLPYHQATAMANKYASDRSIFEQKVQKCSAEVQRLTELYNHVKLTGYYKKGWLD